MISMLIKYYMGRWAPRIIPLAQFSHRGAGRRTEANKA
jgi:hypothetical protein